MKLTSSLKIVKPTPHSFAVACLATLVTAICLAAVSKLTDRSQNLSDAYGANLAASLANSAIEPLLKQDRIALGVLANRTLELPEVSGVAVFTVDNQVLTASGDGERGLRYTEPVTFDRGIMGFVRVSLDEPSAQTALSTILLGLLAILIAPIFTVGAFSVRYIQQPAATGRDSDTGLNISAAPQVPQDHYLIAINLYNQISMTPAARKAELDHANAVAQQIAELYLGEVRNLPGTGLLVHFRASDDSGRALQVVCAAFALTQLFEEFEALDAGAYRLGLHTIGIPVGGELHNDAPELADAALLSALAKRGTIAVSGCFPMQMLRPDQVRSQPLQHPLLDDLDTVASAHLVTGLSPLQQALVTRQVTRLSNQWGTTESESTF